MEKIKIKSWLPIFPGFYNTWFDIFEMNIDEEDVKLINDGKVEIDRERFNNDAAMILSSFIEEKLNDNDIKCNLINPEVDSPRYYNYRNDMVYVTYEVSKNTLRDILSIIMEHEEEFDRYIKENYTSYSGFISFMSNNYKCWLDIDKWIKDTHVFGSILQFLFNDVLESIWHDGFLSEMADDFYDKMFYSEYLNEVVES